MFPDQIAAYSDNYGCMGYPAFGWEVLGRTIRLADVLWAVKAYQANTNPIVDNWDLRDDDLDHQSLELKQMLFDILVK